MIKKDDLMVGKIVYSRIDEGIRDLCRALNRVGARTISSCEGHDNGEEAYVSFHCPQKTLVRIIQRLDGGGAEGLGTQGLHNSFLVDAGDGKRWRVSVSGEVVLCDGDLRYILRVSCPSVDVVHSVLAIMARLVGGSGR